MKDAEGSIIYLKVLSEHWPEGNKEKHNSLVSGSKFEPRTSWI
jgi:hypothetical protein